MPRPESGAESPQDEVRRRYGVEVNDPAHARHTLRLWYRGFWITPVLTLGLLWEAVPGSLLYPYKPTEYIAWLCICFIFTPLVILRALAARQRKKRPKEYWKDLFDTQAKWRHPRWMDWYARITGLAFVLAAFLTERVFLGFAAVVLVLSLVAFMHHERRETRAKLDAIAAGQDPKNAEAP